VITDYVGALSLVVGQRLTPQDVRAAVSKAAGGGASGLNEVAAALTYAEQRWDLAASFDLPDDATKPSQERTQFDPFRITEITRHKIYVRCRDPPLRKTTAWTPARKRCRRSRGGIQ
jgi:hypothetical protein